MNPFDLLPLYSETMYESASLPSNQLMESGNFSQRVLILVKQREWNAENEDFLKKVLSSCNLNDNDYLIKSTDDKSDIFSIINKKSPLIVFLFGVKLESTFFRHNKPNYKPFILNNIKIVLSDELNVVKNDKEKRLLLWNKCIKPLFNIA